MAILKATGDCIKHERDKCVAVRAWQQQFARVPWDDRAVVRLRVRTSSACRQRKLLDAMEKLNRKDAKAACDEQLRAKIAQNDWTLNQLRDRLRKVLEGDANPDYFQPVPPMPSEYAAVMDPRAWAEHRHGSITAQHSATESLKQMLRLEERRRDGLMRLIETLGSIHMGAHEDLMDQIHESDQRLLSIKQKLLESEGNFADAAAVKISRHEPLSPKQWAEQRRISNMKAIPLETATSRRKLRQNRANSVYGPLPHAILVTEVHRNPRILSVIKHKMRKAMLLLGKLTVKVGWAANLSKSNVDPFCLLSLGMWRTGNVNVRGAMVAARRANARPCRNHR